MEDNMVTSELKRILESVDFSRYFAVFNENGIEKGREGLFGVVKHSNLEKYLFTPKIIFGSRQKVSRKEGLKFVKEKLADKIKKYSLYELQESPRFLEYCRKKEIPVEINLDTVSKNYSWNKILRQEGEGAFEEFTPFLHVHNHPNPINLNISIRPSEPDLFSCFNMLENPKCKVVYSLIFGKSENFVGGKEYPFLLLRYDKPLDNREVLFDGFYEELMYDMKTEFNRNNLSREHKLLDVILKGGRQADTKSIGLDWKYFIYDPDKMRIFSI